MMVGLWVGLLCGVGVVAMACRVAKMSLHTREMVAWQHIQMGMGFAATPVVWYFADAAWALLMLAASMVVYVLMGTSRWRDGAPAGTRKDSHGQQQGIPDQRGVLADRPPRKRVHQDGPNGGGTVQRGASLPDGRTEAGAGRHGAVAALRFRQPR